MVWARGRRRWTPGGREAKTSARSRRGAGDSRKAATGERPWAPTEPHPTAPGAVLTGRERDYVPRGLGGFNPWVRKISCRRKWQPTPVFLPGKSHGQRTLPGYIQSTGS